MADQGVTAAADKKAEQMDTGGAEAVTEEVTNDGGVTKRIIEKGTGWEVPATGDEVSVHYVGTLEDGTKFDSSRDRGDPFVFELGRGRVIKAWDAGIKTMRKGEKAVLTCKSTYAYGEQGSPPTIPPNATLIFEVELLHWKSTKDITEEGKGGVLKTTLTEGQGYRTPGAKDEVLVEYSLKVKDGDTFLRSPEGGLEASMADGVVCKAFDLALKKMKQGEKVALIIEPQYGPPQDQLPSGTPADAVLEAQLELKSWHQVSDVTEDGLVVKKVLTESSDYNTPNSEATVRIRYTACLEDGTVIDERAEGNELEFVADEEQVVEGLDLAVMKMKPGEKSVVTIAPKYAWGDQEFKGSKGTVPKGATIVYTVELVSISKAKEAYEMNNAEKLAKASERKEAGNELFRRGSNQAAVKRYKKALDMINYDDQFAAEEKRQSTDIKKSCNLNLAAAYLKLQDYTQSQQAAGKVLVQDASNTKALYRRAQAYLASQDFVEAEQDIKSMLAADSTNRDARLLQRRYREESAAFNNHQRKMYGNMFKPRPAPASEAKQAANRHAEAPKEQASDAAGGSAEPQSHPIEVDRAVSMAAPEQ
ncbi:hypothetical protein WJX73_009452 [Symbiochloris irregularis]|uniref:peptidylprolyl isomerase n=1 Tax=Symbiochloris irregularis TaxID=706552 RepID=A0AAW1PYA2_9CHLO